MFSLSQPLGQVAMSLKRWSTILCIFLESIFTPIDKGPWWSVVSHCQSGYGLNARTRWNVSKNSLSLTMSETLNRSSLLPITQNPQLDNIESDYHSIFIEKHCFLQYFLVYSKILLYKCGYYHLPFLSNI